MSWLQPATYAKRIAEIGYPNPALSTDPLLKAGDVAMAKARTREKLATSSALLQSSCSCHTPGQATPRWAILDQQMSGHQGADSQ